MNKKKIINISIILLVVIIIIIVIVLFVKKPNGDTTRNIIGTELEEKLRVTPNIEKNNDEVLVYEGNEIFYFNYRNNELVYENIIKKETADNYKIIESDNNFYILNKKTNLKSELFNEYIEITKENKVIYILFRTNEQYVLYNVSADKYIKLSNQIIDFYDIYDSYNNLISDKYLIAINENEKYGVIDFDGNTIIDFKYNNISLMGENFLVRKDSKVGIIDKNQKILIDFKYSMLFEYGKNYLSIYNGKYGIIDSNGKELLEHKYDFGLVKNDHVALAIDGKVTFYTNKLIMEPTIKLSNPVKLSSYKFNNNLLLLNDDKTYIFDQNGNNEKILDYKLFTIMYEGKLNDYSNKYLYTRNIENNNINFKVYDKNYNEYYTFDIKLDVDLSNYVMNSSIYTKNNNKYDIYITLLDKNTNMVYKELKYEYDFDNKKEVTYLDLEKSTLENGITYTIDKNNVLRVYNDDKQLSEYKDILYFIDNYYFIDKNGIVYKLNFKYEENPQ